MERDLLMGLSIMGKLSHMSRDFGPKDAIRQPQPLPDNARLLALDSVWMEGDALRQLARVAKTPDCCAAVGMPDLHSGPGIPIGAALAFGETILPRLVGSDAGCGARVVCFTKLKARGDALERRVREAFAGPAIGSVIDGEVDERALLEAVWERGAAAFAELPVPEGLAELASEEREPAWLPASAELPDFLVADERGASFGRALGTIGGGNHFVELGAVEQIFDDAQAKQLGLRRRGHAVLAHSGSRGLGRALAVHWGSEQLREAGEQRRYLGQLAGAVRFAIANRLLLAWRLLTACGAARRSRITGGFDLVHNFVTREGLGEGREAWIHRKGCAPAGAGDPTIILGSRGAPSWVMRGLGCPACLSSVAHGAGRRMTRSEARAKVAHKHTRAALKRTRSGSRVICDDKDLLYEEHPEAYKAIDPVISSLEAAGAATRVAALEPLLTVKL